MNKCINICAEKYIKCIKYTKNRQICDEKYIDNCYKKCQHLKIIYPVKK